MSREGTWDVVDTRMSMFVKTPEKYYIASSHPTGLMSRFNCLPCRLNHPDLA